MIPEDTRLLSFCPTRGRPDKIKDMLDSFDACKSPGTEMFVYVASEEKDKEKYEEVLAGREYVFGDRPRCLVEIVNHVTCTLFPNMPYYQCINDDHYVHTKGFDDVLIGKIEEEGRGWGLAFGRALVNEDAWQTFRHPSAEITSGNIPRTLGYYCTPLIRHFQADVFARDIGEGIGRFFKVDDVIIEHRHIVNNKAEPDDNYREQYDKKNMAKGFKEYYEWCARFKVRDLAKLFRAMRKDDGFDPPIDLSRYPENFGPGHPDWGRPGNNAKTNRFRMEYGLKDRL